MRKYFKIIADDPKFKKMLTLELSDNGLLALNDNINDIEKENTYTIIDLDSCSDNDVENSAKISTVIGYTRKSDITNEFCTAVFQRPFPMSDFIAVFGQFEIERIIPVTKRKENSKKAYILTVEDGCAIWGDTKIPLSYNEHRVLAYLCENRGQIVEREKLYALLEAEDGNMGDVYICHLRRKIDNKLGLKLIYTIRGKGYMLKN